MRLSPTIGGISSVQWRKVERSWRSALVRELSCKNSLFVGRLYMAPTRDNLFLKYRPCYKITRLGIHNNVSLNNKWVCLLQPLAGTLKICVQQV